jgi:anion transporter
MITFWILEPIDHAVTALIGCYLFWALDVVEFPVAFNGFAKSAPWFLFGALLMGEAASQSGLAKRMGFFVLRRVSTTYSGLLFGIVILSFLLNFFVPSGMARLAVMAPIVVGIVAAFGLDRQSNVAKAFFIILTYTCALFDRMIMAGAASILTRGIIEENTGIQIFWTQWLLAYLPALLVTLLLSWVIVQWLYPPEKTELPQGKHYIVDALRDMGSWSAKEQKTLIWLLAAIVLWTTDFFHRTNPAVIALGIGLGLALPGVGVLDKKAVKRINLFAIVFSAGALSMGAVLAHTHSLELLTGSLLHWVGPLLSDSLHGAGALYGAAFLYHFLLANDQSMLSTSLPVLLQLAEAKNLNPIAIGLVWNFATGARLFVYQSSVLVLGYSYGYFEAKDLIKVGALLTVVQGLLLLFLVPLYWPLIGLNWIK